MSTVSLYIEQPSYTPINRVVMTHGTYTRQMMRIYFFVLAATMSEVQGRQTDGSDDKDYCHVCPTVKAKSYCMECKIYLCQSCVGHHKILPASSSHTLLDNYELSPIDPAGHDEDIKQCQFHPNQEVLLYCQDHDALCCCDCMVNHRPCIPKYIANISKEFNPRKTMQTFC